MTAGTKDTVNTGASNDHTSVKATERRRRNLTIAGALTVFVIGMIGLAFAAVPLYELFCRVTGYGGTTQIAESSSDRIVDRVVRLDFDTNVANGLQWRFDAPEPVEMKIGEERQVTFTAVNRSDRPILGTSAFNASPLKVGKYVQKIECFCFTEQLLMPGESKEFPVTFYIDPELANDRNTDDVRAITLSYTFFDKGKAALEQYLSELE
ncbi:MAG: cytochrome c oxidase assembly protein [Rhodospirillales bacterium]